MTEAEFQAHVMRDPWLHALVNTAVRAWVRGYETARDHYDEEPAFTQRESYNDLRRRAERDILHEWSEEQCRAIVELAATFSTTAEDFRL